MPFDAETPEKWPGKSPAIFICTLLLELHIAKKLQGNKVQK